MIVKTIELWDDDLEQYAIYTQIPTQVHDIKEGTPLRVFVEWVEERPRIVFEPAD